MKKHQFPAIVFAVLAACTLSAHAFSLFGGDEKSDAISALRKADKILARADSAYDGGNPDQALELYRKALGIYERVEEKFPGIEDGVASYRMLYCNDQVSQISGGDGIDELSLPPLVPPSSLSIDASSANPVDNAATVDALPMEESVGADIDDVEVAALTPEAIATLLAEARFALDEGRVEDAATASLDILRVDPQNRAARLVMGIVRTRQQRLDEARVALEDLQSEGEDEAVLLALAAVYQASGRNDKALVALDKAIRLDSKRPDPFMNMAWLMLGDGDTESADSYYRIAVRLGAPRDKQIERRLGY